MEKDKKKFVTTFNEKFLKVNFGNPNEVVADGVVKNEILERNLKMPYYYFVDHFHTLMNTKCINLFESYNQGDDHTLSDFLKTVKYFKSVGKATTDLLYNIASTCFQHINPKPVRHFKLTNLEEFKKVNEGNVNTWNWFMSEINGHVTTFNHPIKSLSMPCEPNTNSDSEYVFVFSHVCNNTNTVFYTYTACVS